MATKKKQGALTRMEKAVDEYVVQPVKKLVGMDTKGTAKKRSAAAPKKGTATSRAKAKPGSTPRSATTAGKSKSSPTSRAGGVTRRTAGTPGSRSAR